MTENVLQSRGQADLQVDTKFLQATKKTKQNKTKKKTNKKQKDKIKQQSILCPLAFVMDTNSSSSKNLQVTAFQADAKLLVKT